jgi:protein-tyrosine phosphatase
MAGAILQRIFPETHVMTAGLRPLIGQPADPIAIELMKQRDLDITEHRARSLWQGALVRANLIFVMERRQREFLQDTFPYAHGKIFCLAHYQSQDIPDPYKMGKKEFFDTLSLIDRAIEIWTPSLSRIFNKKLLSI